MLNIRHWMCRGGFIKIIKSFIKNFDYTGVDVNPKMINLAKKKKILSIIFTKRMNFTRNLEIKNLI